MAKNKKQKIKQLQTKTSQVEQNIPTEIVREERPVERKSTPAAINTKRLLISGIVLLAVIGAFGLNKANTQNKTQVGDNVAYVSPIPAEDQVTPTESAQVTVQPSSVIPTKTDTNNGNEKPSAIIITGDKIPSQIVKKLPNTKTDAFVYTVRNNDSLARIGKTFCNDRKAYLYLSESNHLTVPYALHVGQKLTIACQ